MWYFCVLLWIRIWHQLIYSSPKSTAIWGHRSPIHPVIAIPIALWSWHEPTKPLSPAAGRSPLHLRNSLKINIHFCICDLMTRTGTIIIGFNVCIIQPFTVVFVILWHWTQGALNVTWYDTFFVFFWHQLDFTKPPRLFSHSSCLGVVVGLQHQDIAALQCSCHGQYYDAWYSITLLMVVASETASATCHTCHHNRTVVTRPAIHCLSIRRKTKSLEKRLAKAWLRWSCKQFDTNCDIYFGTSVRFYHSSPFGLHFFWDAWSTCSNLQWPSQCIHSFNEDDI